jgi:hypothetical protein
MAIATNEQIQTYVDTKIRPLCEQVRAVKAAIDDAKATIDDVYAALTADNPTWVDGNTSLPPHYLTPSDVLALNAFITALQTAIAGDGNYPIVLKSCVRDP